MIWEYAHQAMMLAIATNLLNRDGFVCAILLASVSVLAQQSAHIIDGVAYYVVYAMFQYSLIRLYLLCSQSRIADHMALISIIGVCVQLVGILLWVLYFESDMYMVLAEAVFIVEIIRLTTHGIGKGVSRYCRGHSLGGIHDHTRR